MVAVDVVENYAVPALSQRLAASLGEERRRKDAGVLSDEVALHAHQLNAKPFEVEQVKLPAKLFQDELMCEVLVAGAQRLRADEHKHVGVVLHLEHSSAVGAQLDSPVRPNRVREDGSATSFIKSDDGITTLIACAA